MARDGTAGKKGKGGVTLIRKEEVVEGGHHGGAWKVAYADFVTAMMAFFLLMWLLNATTEEQRKGLADYFSPSSLLSHNSSGSGQPFGGHTAFDQGAMVSDRGAVQVLQGKTPVPVDVEEDDSDTPAKPQVHKQEDADKTDRDDRQDAPAGKGGDPDASGYAAQARARVAGHARESAERGGGERAGQAPAPSAETETQDAAAHAANAGRQDGAELARREAKALADAAEQLRAAVRDDPSLAPFARQLAVDVTPEGLRIQILDEDRSPMFASGSAVPNERARGLLQKVAPVLGRLNEGVAITGHTDAAPYRNGDKSNWELSTERANATRRLLAEAGLAEGRVRTVTGSADRDPLLPADPLAAANRRIAITVLRAFPQPAGPSAATAPSPAAALAAPAAPLPAAPPPKGP